jgi:hypothetical protein
MEQQYVGTILEDAILAGCVKNFIFIFYFSSLALEVKTILI